MGMNVNSAKSGMDRLSEAAGTALKLVERVNARHEAITGTLLFKSSPEYAAALARFAEPSSDMESFGAFIDAVHLFFYKGSGDGTRIMAFAAVPEFLADVRALWGVRDDIKNHRMQEAAAKLPEANRVFEKYGGKRAEDFSAEDFISMQAAILEKTSDFLSFLIR